jgi:hypothetical protein
MHQHRQDDRTHTTHTYLDEAHVSVPEFVREHLVVLFPNGTAGFLRGLKVHKRLQGTQNVTCKRIVHFDLILISKLLHASLEGPQSVHTRLLGKCKAI